MIVGALLIALELLAIFLVTLFDSRDGMAAFGVALVAVVAAVSTVFSWELGQYLQGLIQ